MMKELGKEWAKFTPIERQQFKDLSKEGKFVSLFINILIKF
jgi:hypothetical protein